MTGRRFRTILTVRGRATGTERRTELLAVLLDGRIYLTRHAPDSDWYKNCIAAGRAAVTVDGKTIAGSAEQVADGQLVCRVSGIKYPGQKRAAERRVAICVIPDEQL